MRKLYTFFVVVIPILMAKPLFAQIDYSTHHTCLEQTSPYNLNGAVEASTFKLYSSSCNPSGLTVTATINNHQPDFNGDERLVMGVRNNLSADVQNVTPQGVQMSGTFTQTNIGGFETFAPTENWQDQNVTGNEPYYLADVTYTFSQEVTNPVIHFSALGGEYSLASLSTGFSVLYELATSGITMNKLTGSSDFAVGTYGYLDSNFNYRQLPNTIHNSDYRGTTINEQSGSVQLVGTFTSVTFKVRLYRRAGNAGLDSSNFYSGDRFRVGFTVPLEQQLVNVSGTIFFDDDALLDNKVDGFAFGPEDTYAVLVDSGTGLVVGSQLVVTGTGEANSGTYSFTGAPGDYYVILSRGEKLSGEAAPVEASTQVGYIFTGENIGIGAGSDGDVDGKSSIFNVNTEDVVDVNFGLTRGIDIVIP